MKKFLITLICLLTCFSLSANEKKVALLFLTRSDLNHTKLWKEWIDFKKFNVYNHSKNRCSDKWFSQFRIKDIQPTEWGFVLYGQRALLKEALKDPDNYKFVLLSESCVPLWPAWRIHNTLVSYPESHMRTVGIWWSGDPHRTLHEFPVEHHLGNHQWIILNRKHAQMMADDDYWIHLAMKHIACDEAYPSTFFSMNGVLDEFRNEFTTFVDWTRGGPYVFTKNNHEDYQILLNAKYNVISTPEPCMMLFARKFSPKFPIKTLKQLIEFGTMD